MNSSLIGKIEKARRYAEERERMQVTGLSIHFHGENGDHDVSLTGDAWNCTCEFFEGYRTCAHTMALEHVLHGMIPSGATSMHLQHV